VDGVARAATKLKDTSFKSASLNDFVCVSLARISELGTIVDGSLEALGPDIAVKLLDGLDSVRDCLNMVAAHCEDVSSGVTELARLSGQLVSSSTAAVSCRDTLETTLTKSIAAVAKRADNSEIALSWASGYLRAVVDERTKWQERNGVNPAQLPELQHFHDLCRQALGRLDSRTERAPTEHADRTVERFVHRSLEGHSRYVTPAEEIALLRSVLNQARVNTGAMTKRDIATLYAPAAKKAMNGLRADVRAMKADVQQFSELLVADFDSARTALFTLKTSKRGAGSPRNRRRMEGSPDSPRTLTHTESATSAVLGSTPNLLGTPTATPVVLSSSRRQLKPMCLHAWTQTDRGALESDVAMPGERSAAPGETAGTDEADLPEAAAMNTGEWAEAVLRAAEDGTADANRPGRGPGISDADFWGDDDSNQDEVLFRRYHAAGARDSLDRDSLDDAPPLPRQPQVQPRSRAVRGSAAGRPPTGPSRPSGTASATARPVQLSTHEQQLVVPKRLPSAAGASLDRLNAKVAKALARAKEIEAGQDKVRAGQRGEAANSVVPVAPVVVKPPAVPQADRNRARATASASARPRANSDLGPQDREHFEGWLASRGSLM